MAGPIYQFAGFRLDCGNFELRRNGAALRVERMPMELLILLVSRQGELVTREEIAQHLWSSEVFVDTEHGINTAIRKIRYLLRDDPESPRILQTVKGKGYRVICPVESLNGRPAEEAAAANSLPSTLAVPAETVPLPSPAPAFDDRRAKHANWLWIGAGSVAAVLVAGAAWYLYWPVPSLRVTEFKPITHDGRTKNIAGTDGSRIYLNFRGQTGNVISEVAVSGGDMVPVKVTLPGPSLWGVSADGSSLLVATDDKGRQSLWGVQVPGGSVRHLVDAQVWNAAWSPDGKSLAYETSDGELFVSKSDGTGARRVFSSEHQEFSFVEGTLVWSPDSSRFRFTRGNAIWEMGANGEGLHEVLPGWRPDAVKCCGNWTPDGRIFLFLVKDGLSDPLLPGNELWAVSEPRGRSWRGGGNPTQLAPGPIRWDTPVPSKDGKKIFVRGVILRGELVRYDAKSQQLQPWLGGISAESVTFSPADDSIAYVTFPEGVLWRANRDGSNRVQLTSPPMYPFNPHFSPDGTRILFYCFSGGGKVKGYIVAAKGGPPQLLAPEDKEDQIDPSWSPDGKQVVYGWPDWGRGNTKHVLRILDLKSREVVTVPDSQGMWSPRWSPNGRYIAGLNSNGGISVFDLQTKRWWEVQHGEQDYPTWSSDSRFIYFLWSLDGPPGVYRVPVAGGAPERVVDLSGFRFAEELWFGLDPADTPMLLRDTGSDDIYALTVEEK